MYSEILISVFSHKKKSIFHPLNVVNHLPLKSSDIHSSVKLMVVKAKESLKDLLLVVFKNNLIFCEFYHYVKF